MATDDTSLILSISADVRQLSRALKRMESDTSRSTRAVEKQFDDMGKNVESRVNKLGTSITGAIKNFGSGLAGGLAAGLGVQQFTRFADGATRITNALKVAGVEGKNLAETYERLGKIALANGASFESVANLYAKVTSASKELGITSRQAEEFTRRIAVGLRASGTDASAASAGIMQLNQALASGVLRGDEFNSVAENLPVVAKAIADGMGVTVGRLRELAAEGELTATKVFDAFMRGSEGLDAQAAKTSTTFSGAFENISTALTMAAGEFDKTTGASDAFAKIVNNAVVPAIIGLGEAISDTAKRHNALANDLQKFAQQTGIEQGVINAVKALQDLGRQADPLVAAFQRAMEQIRAARQVLGADFRGIADEFSATMKALQAEGQGEIASGLSGAFIGLTEKIANGTIAAKDFDSVIAALVATGNTTADQLAGRLELIQGKFQNAGDAAQKSFNDAGQALADALGANALATVDALAAKIGNTMPEAVGRFTSALREALGLLAQADSSTAILTGQLKTFSPYKLGQLNTNAEGGVFDMNRHVQLQNARDRIAAIESRGSGDYKAIGSVVESGDRAYGRYQVMGANVGPWSQEALGFRITPEQLLNNPGFQDKIFDHVFGGYLDKYGAEGAAQAWFGGEGAVGKTGRPDMHGTTVGEYGKRFIGEQTDAWDGMREAVASTTEAVNEQSQAYDGLGQIAGTVLQGIAGAMADGKIEGKELLQILLQVGQQLLTMKGPGGGSILSSLFGGLGGGGGGADPWAGMRGGGLLGGLIIPGILHDGGTVGKDGYGHGRMVPSSVFAGARKFHKGLMPDEFPAILQRGETVIPRGGFQGGSQQPMGIADVRVSVDNNGNLQAYVQKVSQQEARTTTRAGLRQYDRELTNSFGGRMVRAQAEQL